MAMSQATKKVASLGLPDGAPEILVDGFQRVSIVNDIVRLNFFSLQAGAKGSTHSAVLVCRLAMSLPALTSFKAQLDELVADLVKQNIIQEQLGDA